MSCQQVPRLPEDPYTFTEPPVATKFYNSQLKVINPQSNQIHTPDKQLRINVIVRMRFLQIFVSIYISCVCIYNVYVRSLARAPNYAFANLFYVSVCVVYEVQHKIILYIYTDSIYTHARSVALNQTSPAHVSYGRITFSALAFLHNPCKATRNQHLYTHTQSQ